MNIKRCSVCKNTYDLEECMNKFNITFTTLCVIKYWRYDIDICPACILKIEKNLGKDVSNFSIKDNK